MVISRTMVCHYLAGVSSRWFGAHREPPTDPIEWNPDAEHAADEAERNGDLPFLRTALEYLLLRPEIDAADWLTAVYPLDDAQVRDVVRALWLVTCARTQPARLAPGQVYLPEMAWPEWERCKATGLATRMRVRSR